MKESRYISYEQLLQGDEAAEMGYEGVWRCQHLKETVLWHFFRLPKSFKRLNWISSISHYTKWNLYK